LKTFAAKFTKAEAVVCDKYYKPGVHSDDTTSASGEGDHPLHVRLFLDYFRWKDENPSNRRTNDNNNRDVRRMTGQSFIGAQPPLGENGQVLRTEITRLNAPQLEHLATRSIGIERTASTVTTAADTVDQLALVSNNTRVRSRSTTPPPPRRVRSNNNISTSISNNNYFMQNISISLGNISRSLNPSFDNLFSSFQSAQAMLRQAQQDDNDDAIAFARDSIRYLRQEMAGRVPRLDDDDA
jgi:hypothetical protein